MCPIVVFVFITSCRAPLDAAIGNPQIHRPDHGTEEVRGFEGARGRVDKHSRILTRPGPLSQGVLDAKDSFGTSVWVSPASSAHPFLPPFPHMHFHMTRRVSSRGFNSSSWDPTLHAGPSIKRGTGPVMEKRTERKIDRTSEP